MSQNGYGGFFWCERKARRPGRRAPFARLARARARTGPVLLGTGHQRTVPNGPPFAPTPARAFPLHQDTSSPAPAPRSLAAYPRGSAIPHPGSCSPVWYGTGWNGPQSPIQVHARPTAFPNRARGDRSCWHPSTTRKPAPAGNGARRWLKAAEGVTRPDVRGGPTSPPDPRKARATEPASKGASRRRNHPWHEAVLNQDIHAARIPRVQTSDLGGFQLHGNPVSRPQAAAPTTG